MSETEHSRSLHGRPAVLQIIPRLDAGGAERTTIDIVRALTEAGCRALVASEGGRLERELSAAGGTLIRIPVASKNPATMIANIGRLVKIIREENVALVHARSRAPAWSALCATRMAGAPFVTTYHGIYTGGSRLKRAYNSVMVRADAVIANSHATADHIRKAYGFVPKRLAVIHRGLDLGEFDPAGVPPARVASLRGSWGANDATRLVLLPGRLTRWKGHLVLIEAVARLHRAGRLPADIRVVFAGDAQGRQAYADELRAAISRAGLNGVFVFAGHIDDMAPAYLAADAVVSASTEPEAFGRVAIEAGAMERPVIATDHGGTRETVLAGVSGLVVPPDDAAALAEALAALFAMPWERLAEMGAQGRIHVAAHFSVARMCADTLALYAELIAARPKP